MTREAVKFEEMYRPNASTDGMVVRRGNYVDVACFFAIPESGEYDNITSSENDLWLYGSLRLDLLIQEKP